MALTIGIVGLPNAGKSTLFNALTKNTVLAANYPFATIEPNIGVVGVPDPRLPTLAALFQSARVVPATVQFVDIAGIVRGASVGEGLGNAFLANIRESDAICQVTRVFRDDDVVHVDGEVSPADDISTIQTELILADLQTVEKALPRLEKEVRLKKGDAPGLAAVREAKAALEAGTPITSTAIDRALVGDLMLLTAKPILYVFNCDADELGDKKLRDRMSDLVAPAEAIFLDAKFEAELVELGDDDEAREMLAESGVDEPGLDVLARVGFQTLGLQTYLTAGPKESRAWTIRRGATAPEAAAVIHTDFQRGFIKAEIVSYDDLVEAGLVDAHLGEHLARLVLVAELDQLRLELRVQEDRLGRRDQIPHLLLERLVGELVGVAVEDEQVRLGRHQHQFPDRVAVHVGRDDRRTGLEVLLRGPDRLQDDGALLLQPGFLLQPRDRLLDGLQVGQDQLGLDGGDVRGRVRRRPSPRASPVPRRRLRARPAPPRTSRRGRSPRPAPPGRASCS